MNENIEVLDDDFTKEDNIIGISDILKDNSSKNDVISLDRLFAEEDEEEVVVDAYEEDLEKEEKKQKMITRIQIGSIIFLFVIASLIYFFGYDLFEPFIKID